MLARGWAINWMTMARIQLRLLGAFALFDDQGVEIPVRGRKARAFLGYLALNPDRPHTREILATFFWGERQDAQARQSLRQALLTLRRLLGHRAPDIVEIDDEAILFWVRRSKPTRLSSSGMRKLAIWKLRRPHMAAICLRGSRFAPTPSSNG